MHFHSGCHGTNILFSADRTLAKRTKTYYHGITFSERPQTSGETVTLLLVEENKSWNGNIRFGLTNRNPDEIESLPPFSIPNLTSDFGTWAKPLSDQHQNVGAKIGLSFTNDGTLSLFVDDECVETWDLCVAVDVLKPVWTLVDIYGSITSVRLISLEADNVPVEIIARGEDAQAAYREASYTGFKRVYRTRLMLVGQERVGKTSLRKFLMGQSFNKDEDITDGIDVSEIDVTSSEWTHCATDCESEGQLRKDYIQALADNMVQKLTKQCDDGKTSEEVASVCEDASLETSSRSASSANAEVSVMKQADDLLDITSNNSAGDNVVDNQEASSQISTLGSHQDIPGEVVEEVERRLRNQRQARQNLLEEDKNVSVEDDTKIAVSIWDFAGQDLYYTTHQVFLSRRAVYLVVFDLSQDLDKPASILTQRTDNSKQDHEMTCLDFLDFWLRSIYTYTTPNKPAKGSLLRQLSPPIFIVGTHKDLVDPDPQKRTKMVEGKFAMIRQHLKDKHYRQHVVNPFYAVENSLDNSQEESVVALRKHIASVLRDEPYMGDAIPLRWLLFESAIKKAMEKGEHFMTLEQVKEITHSLGMETESSMFTLLQFYHDLGHIIYFGGEDGSNQTVRDMVILNPKWLIDVFRRVITVKDITEQWPIYMDAWTRLDTEGILEDRLIDHMWSHTIDQKPALLQLMSKFDLLCPLLTTQNNTSTSNSEPCYYVPSRMKPSNDHQHWYTADSHKSSAVVFYIDFDGFLSDGIFHRLLAQTVRWSQDQGGFLPNLHYRHASLYADDLHQIELQMSTSHQAKITVVVTRSTVFKTSTECCRDDDDGHVAPLPQACNKVKAFFTKALTELKQTWAKRIRYSFRVDCPACSSSGVPPYTLDLDECLTKGILICASRHRIDTAGIKNKYQASASQHSASSSSASSCASSLGLENLLATVYESDLKRKEKIGDGGYGVVFLATHKYWGDVAVKKLNVSSAVMAEAKQMWRTISSKYLVRIMGIIDDPNNPSLVMEYAKYGSLNAFLKYMSGNKVLPRRVQIILNITLGMNYLHTLPSPIVHRDLKCNNVFVGEGFKAMIGDMGLAVNTASIKTRSRAEMVGTISHIPPEVWAGTITKPTTYWDVYTFGITLYEILTNGEEPWPQVHVYAGDAIVSGWVKDGHRPDLECIPVGTPDDLIDCMQRCWQSDPVKRPSFQELKNEVGNMYSTKYEEKDLNAADKEILDKITEDEQSAVRGASNECDTSGYSSSNLLDTSNLTDDW